MRRISFLCATVLALAGSGLLCAQQPAAVFTDTNGGVHVTVKGAGTLPAASGESFTGSLGVAQDASGNVFVVGADSSGGVWMNRFKASTSAWDGWQFSNGYLTPNSGMTAAVDANGVLWFAGRYTLNRFWIDSWNGDLFNPWVQLAQGYFESDSIPQIAIPSDGSIYVIGKDTGGRVWSDSYIPASGTGTGTLTGWVDRGNAIFGQPSVTAGTDGYVYVGVRDTQGGSALSITQIPAHNGSGANTWTDVGGWVVTDPVIAATPGTIWLSALASGGYSRVVPYFLALGAGSWQYTNMLLTDQTMSQQSNGLYLAGRASGRSVWWYDMAAQTWSAGGVTAAGPLAGAQQGVGSPAYPMLSINGGSNAGQTLPAVTVPLNFTTYDSGGVVNDIAFVQFALVDSNGSFLCYGAWGPPNAISLYSTTLLPQVVVDGAYQGNAFCTISLNSITPLTGGTPGVTGIVNFAINPGSVGTYLVLAQVNVAGCMSGVCSGPWPGVGTLTVQPPTTLNPAPGGAVTDITSGDGTYSAGDSYRVTITGPPNESVSAVADGIDTGVLGYTDSTGRFSTSGTLSLDPVNGSYLVTWYVAGTPGLSFQVAPAAPRCVGSSAASFDPITQGQTERLGVQITAPQASGFVPGVSFNITGANVNPYSSNVPATAGQNNVWLAQLNTGNLLGEYSATPVAQFINSQTGAVTATRTCTASNAFFDVTLPTPAPAGPAKCASLAGTWTDTAGPNGGGSPTFVWHGLADNGGTISTGTVTGQFCGVNVTWGNALASGRSVTPPVNLPIPLPSRKGFRPEKPPLLQPGAINMACLRRRFST